MKLGVLFSGGKDSTYAAWLACKNGYDLSCLISIVSENRNSFMFHTPSISNVGVQAKSMGVPLVSQKTKGEKEKELDDLRKAIIMAKKKYGIGGIVTGAVLSVYQASRVMRICNELGLEVFNPLWQKNQEELLKELVNEKFDVRIVGVFAYPFDKSWLGRKIDKVFISEIKTLEKKWGINVAGEGGEYESFVVNCPLFKKGLKIVGEKDSSDGENNFRRDLKVVL